MPSAAEISRILKEEGVVEFDEDPRRLNREQLAVHFASARSDRIILTRLLKSVIWCAYRRIQPGLEVESMPLERLTDHVDELLQELV